jgi:hypothetical protein
MERIQAGSARWPVIVGRLSILIASCNRLFTSQRHHWTHLHSAPSRDEARNGGHSQQKEWHGCGAANDQLQIGLAIVLRSLPQPRVRRSNRNRQSLGPARGAPSKHRNNCRRLPSQYLAHVAIRKRCLHVRLVRDDTGEDIIVLAIFKVFGIRKPTGIVVYKPITLSAKMKDLVER